MRFWRFRWAARRLQSRQTNALPNWKRPCTPALTHRNNRRPSWPEEIYAVLQRYDVRQVPYVPDAGHSKLIERVLGSDTMRGIPLTTEEEGVALVAGAWARRRSAVCC